LATAFTTNGTLLTKETGRRLLEANVQRMDVSIDGPEGVHDRLRGAGTYQTVLDNLRAFLAEKKAAGRRSPVVTVKLTVNPGLVGRFERTIAELREATADEVDAYTVHHLWFITREELQQHQSEVQPALGCSAGGAASHLSEQAATLDVQVLAAEIEHLRRTPRVRFYPDLDGEELLEYYAEGESNRRCRSPWRTLLVKPNGEARFCPDEWIDDYPLGSIVHDDIRGIWAGPQAARFRRILAARGSFPGCKRCSWLR
jgi:radical SAM protein with 4Fe4S-binding SPASM domain